MNSRKQPQPWPKYTRSLKTPPVYDGNIVLEVEERIKALCALYRINDDDPSWERQLLITLLHRHVPGFRLKSYKRKSVDNPFICEAVDSVKANEAKKTGHPISTDAAVAMIVEELQPGDPFYGMTHARMMRIYAEREKHFQEANEDAENACRRLRDVMRGQAAIAGSPQSFAALLLAAMRGRYR